MLGRDIGLMALLFLLAGCGAGSQAPLLPSLTADAKARPEAEPDGPALRVALDGRQTYARLIQESGNRRLWRTGTGLVLATEGGRVMATSGAGEILVATRFTDPDPLTAPVPLLTEQVLSHRAIDLMAASRAPESMRFGVPVECQLTASPTPDPAILLVEEQCRATGEGRFTNRFWVEAEGGAIIRSEQWIGPGIGLLSVEFL
jgi:hypothetical protein